MSSLSALEVKGSLAQFPTAELLAEIDQTILNGSLRISDGTSKFVVYFRDGRVAHAVSNLRKHRLFSIGLERGVLSKELLAKHANFPNDVEFSNALLNSGVIPAKDLKELSVAQVESILIDLLGLASGEWVYSPHTRLRSDMVLDIQIHSMMIDYARCVPGKYVFDRFRCIDERFGVRAKKNSSVVLQPHEEYVLGQFENGEFTLDQLRKSCALPEFGLFQAIYALWLGGYLIRHDWSAAIREQDLKAIRSAKLSRVSEAAKLPIIQMPTASSDGSLETDPALTTEPGSVEKITSVQQMTINEFLERVETADTFYDVLGVEVGATSPEIRSSYLALAKNFHPDRFHREGAEKHGRIQSCFTKLSHAYESIKTDESREAYNLKIRKELEFREKRRKAGNEFSSENMDAQAELGLASFEEGIELYQVDDFSNAATHLARAVHYSPNNALYHAYFGSALSNLGDKYQHRAESELQAAVKLDPKNTKIRLMLVDLFTEMNMHRRAEGELKRFLEQVPGDREALDRLQSLAAIE